MAAGNVFGQTFLHQLLAFGGRVFVEDFYPQLDSEEAHIAMQWFLDIKPYMPPNAPELDWDKVAS